MRYRLIHHGNVMLLSPGATLIGRSVACKVVLDDSDVSRRHARLSISEQGVVIEDLDSANGVYVNGERISEKRPLSNGDCIQLGAEELQLLVDNPGPASQQRSRASAARAANEPSKVLDAFWDDEDDVDAEYGQPTTVNQKVHLLAQALQELLVRGEIDHTDQVLIDQLGELLDRAGSGVPLAAQHAETATRVSLKLARISREARWVEYVADLYSAIGMALPAATLTEIESLIDHIAPLDVEVLRRHVASLRMRQRPLSPTERASIERIEKLEQRLAKA